MVEIKYKEKTLQLEEGLVEKSNRINGELNEQLISYYFHLFERSNHVKLDITATSEQELSSILATTMLDDLSICER